ncbi:MAG: PorV/PorQ family protein, partial [bacterium]
MSTSEKPKAGTECGRLSGGAAVFLCMSISLLSLVAPRQAGSVSFTKEAAGTTGADFLNLGVGARALALGGAYSAVAEDASGVYWNPAGLVQISRLSASFMRANYLADISYQYAAYAHRLDDASVVAGSILMTDIGTIKHTDRDNNDLGNFSPQDQAYTVSYSRGILELSDKERDVSMGVSAKYIRSKIVESA